MKYDYRELYALMDKRGYNQTALAAELRMPDSALSMRLNSKRDFRQTEIIAICSILGVPQKDVWKYFFNRTFS